MAKNAKVEIDIDDFLAVLEMRIGSNLSISSPSEETVMK